MEHSLNAMETALRVLRALNAKRPPDPVDIDALRAYVGSPPENTPLDELACDVIQKALQRRANLRGLRVSASANF